jgi:lipoprotein-anchoring transpeptidase ErfK/SrfK
VPVRRPLQRQTGTVAQGARVLGDHSGVDRPCSPAALSVIPHSGVRAVLAIVAALVMTAAPATTAAAARVQAPASTTPATSEAPSPTTPSTTDAPPSTSPPVSDGAVVPAAPTRAVSYAARLVVPVVARKEPSGAAARVATLKPYGSWNGGPVVLAIAEVRDIDGVRWLRVRLPLRPNGSSGWLQEDSVEVRRLRYRVEVSRRARTLTLLRDGARVASTRVVIGAAATPSPTGTFAVLEVVRQPKGSLLGPWALHLTAHSTVLDNYGGGPGRVALHGRSGTLRRDPLGSARSHGCIRMPNAFVARLHDVAVEGTPVIIR